MADVRHTEIFDCSPEQFFEIIKDFESYPKFLKDVKTCEVLSEEGPLKRVEFSISVIKSFKYITENIEHAPNELSWKFVEGDLFKSMSGHWRLQKVGDQTKAEYYVEAGFGLFVPKAMVKSVLSANLPAMMKAYHKRVAELFPYEEPKEPEPKSESKKNKGPQKENEKPQKKTEEMTMQEPESKQEPVETKTKAKKVELNWDAENSEEKKGLSETVKQLFVSGLSSGFISEDTLKQYLGDLKLPKDVLSQVVRGAQKSKDDIMGKVSNELTRMIQKVDIVKELTKLLCDHKISISADIEFSPKKKKDQVLDEKLEVSSNGSSTQN